MLSAARFFLFLFFIDTFLPRILPMQGFFLLMMTLVFHLSGSGFIVRARIYTLVNFVILFILALLGVVKGLQTTGGEVMANLACLPLAALNGSAKKPLLSAAFIKLLRVSCLVAVGVAAFALLFFDANRSTLFGISSLAFGKYIILYVYFSSLLPGFSHYNWSLRSIALAAVVTHKSVILIGFFQLIAPSLFRFLIILLVWISCLLVFNYLSNEYPIFISVSYRLHMLTDRLYDFWIADVSNLFFGMNDFSSTHSSLGDILVHFGILGSVLTLYSLIFLNMQSKITTFYCVLPLLFLSMFSAGLLGLRDAFVWGFIGVNFFHNHPSVNWAARTHKLWYRSRKC
jgi:hypothetical protein